MAGVPMNTGKTFEKQKMQNRPPIIVTYSVDMNSFRAFDPEKQEARSYGASRLKRIGSVFRDPRATREKRNMYMRFTLELAQNWVGLNTRERRDIKFFFLHEGAGYRIPETHDLKVGVNTINQIWPQRSVQGQR